MSKQIFIVHGDVTQLAADVLVYPTDSRGSPGHLYAAFERNLPAFPEAHRAAMRREGVSNRRRRLLPGDAVWVELPHAKEAGGRQPQGVVVVGVIGNDVSPVEKSRRAVTAALRTAAERLGPGDGRRRLVAIPGLRMGAALTRRRGDEEAWAERREAAQVQIEAAQDGLKEHPDLDVAFIAYTPDVYHLYLKAREAVCGGPSGAGGVEVPPALVQAIRAGECVLFIGSGLSTGAGLPSWNALIRRLADEMGVAAGAHETVDFFLDVAQVYRQRFGPERLSQAIAEHFGGAFGTPTLAHYLLMSLGVHYVVTTNYDSLLERTLTALRRDPIKVVQETDIAKTGQLTAQFVVKFHGDADAPGTLVLSRDDYEDFFDDRPAMASLLEGLLLNQTFFFVGYSLNDPNFRQIYSRIARILKASKRAAFATTFDSGPSQLASQTWESKNLRILPMPGQGDAEKSHSLTRFLDGLAARAADQPKTLLASGGDGPPAALSQTLTRLGEQVEAASYGALGREAALELASMLRFLTGHGWRPTTQESAWQTWRRLAGAMGDDAEQKRAMLREALRQTEKLTDADAIRAELLAS